MNKNYIAERFLRHNFHDMLLKGVNVRPAGDRRSKSAVEVILEDYDTAETIQILFEQPGNISFTADFDVLIDNAGFGNTDRSEISTDSESILKTIHRQRSKWNVKYHEGVRSPIERKTENINKYIAFKLLFFGGTLEILAKKYKINKTKNGQQINRADRG